MGRAQEKIHRLKLALSHREPDRVPAGEFFWTGFLKRCRETWGADFDPYRFWDLDYVVVTPNMDPHIQPFEVVTQKGDDIVVKTGFGATIRRSGDLPMPHYEAFSVTRPEQMDDFEFDPADDHRRFHHRGDDQINGVGDALARDIPAWDERVDGYLDDFAVFGSICEPYEYLWRIVGTENALLWMVEAPEHLHEFIDRVGTFLVDLAGREIAAGEARLSGMVIWGDIAYRNGMLFRPRLWRKWFKPHVRDLIRLCHSHDLPVIYHGCGNAAAVFEDLVDIHLDAYNPLEAKAGLDVVELKALYGENLAFVGNIDVRVLERGDPEAIRSEVRYKLQAARGGGYVFQSDHSVSSAVAPESYDLAVRTLRELGTYPLTL
jgi:uroporphyrinogen decarboxylase